MISKNPIIMGILNLTPDSFFDGGKHHALGSAIKHIENMLSEGAQIIDIGGESTKPFGQPIDDDTEWNRVQNVLKIAVKYNIPISIDTYKTSIAERALQIGAKIINDIAPFEHLEEVIVLAKQYSADLIITHNSRKHYFQKSDDLILDIIHKFRLAITTSQRLNFDTKKLIFDIGLGFGKTDEQNIDLLKNLQNIREQFSQRFLIGASRKSFMRLFNEDTPNDRLPCTLAVTISSYLSGCDIFRVHDVRENYEVLKLVQSIYGN